MLSLFLKTSADISPLWESTPLCLAHPHNVIHTRSLEWQVLSAASEEESMLMRRLFRFLKSRYSKWFN
jgi:hypothetical protein